MKLLNKTEYMEVERTLRTINQNETTTESRANAVDEIVKFFKDSPYAEFLEIFYLNRHNYKHRFPTNRQLFRYISNKLYLQESTLYLMRKEIVYKSAMIFYKYNVL